MKMTVIGTGYLGATRAACMAELGHEVLGVDMDAEKIRQLKAGEVPFYEPSLSDVLRRNIERKTLNFTTDYAAPGAFSTVHFLAVGTPQLKGSYAADVSAVFSVVRELIPHLS